MKTKQRNVTPTRSKVDRLYNKLRETNNQGLGNKDLLRQISSWNVEPYKSEISKKHPEGARSKSPISHGKNIRGKDLSNTPSKVDSGLRTSAAKSRDPPAKFGDTVQVDIEKIYKSNKVKYSKTYGNRDAT